MLARVGLVFLRRITQIKLLTLFAGLGLKFRDLQKLMEPVKTSMHTAFEDQRHVPEEVEVRSGGNYVDGFLVLPIKRQLRSPSTEILLIWTPSMRYHFIWSIILHSMI